MRRWADSWEGGKPGHKSILLYGPAGTGKTTAALALGHEMGWDVLEVNASDKRSQSCLEEIAKSSKTKYSLLMGRCLKLIILDEVDGLSGTNDRGGIRAITRMIRESVNPIIMICNDYYSTKLRYLRRIAKGIQFGKPSDREIQTVLREISRKEGLQQDFLAIKTLAERAAGDFRSAINDLEAISINGTISKEDLHVPGLRKTETSIFSVLDLIFNGDPESVKKARDLDLRPEQLLEWVAENVHIRFTDDEDRARAFEMISSADIYLSWVHRRMHWGFWGYATDMMTQGLGSLSVMRFPTYRRRLYYSRPNDYFRHRVMMKTLSRPPDSESSKRGTLASELGVAHLIGGRCHMSMKAVYRDFLPYLRIIQENNPEMAGAMLRWVGINDEDLCDLPFG